jgi:hypothetical protein
VLHIVSENIIGLEIFSIGLLPPISPLCSRMFAGALGVRAGESVRDQHSPVAHRRSLSSVDAPFIFIWIVDLPRVKLCTIERKR